MLILSKAKLFSNITYSETDDEMKQKMQDRFFDQSRLQHILADPVYFATVTGSQDALQRLQDDLRSAGYKVV